MDEGRRRGNADRRRLQGFARCGWRVTCLLMGGAVLMAIACAPSIPLPTATPGLHTTPSPLPTSTLIVPTPPPPATLTAIIRAFLLTRTPALMPTLVPPATRTRVAATQVLPTPVVPAPSPERSPAPTLPTIGLVPEAAPPHALVQVHGVGWPPNGPVSIRLGPSLENLEETAQVLTQADGVFVATIPVPERWGVDSLLVVVESLDGQRRAVARLYLIRPTATATAMPTPPLPTLTPTPSPTPHFTGWRGEYFANPTLQGTPLLVRDDPEVNFTWHDAPPAPGLPADNFSVRWTRTFELVPGGYRFHVRVDDGVRLWVNGELLIDEWHVTAPAEYDANQMLEDGATEIRIEYFDAGGNAEIYFTWTYLGRFPDWRASYYNNRDLSGPAALVRNDVAIDFIWGARSPASEIQPDNFSARWTRTVHLEAGTYRFHAQADDGVRVWIDGRLIIDEWHLSSGEQDYTADLPLVRGLHDLRVEYFEAGGNAEVHVWWENLSAYTDWRGAYYPNRFLSGRPAFVRNDPSIDFNWGAGGPDGLGPDNFSVRWTRRKSFAGGTYRFFAEHDDGVRIWVDAQLIIDEWYETGPVTHHADVALVTGGHEIRVEYFEGSGEARIRVWWEIRPYR